MSIGDSGLNSKIREKITLPITVDVNHPLVQLANALDWSALAEKVQPDLKRTTAKWKWWLGRRLELRIHLGVYLLQQLLNETDRGMERQIRDNAAYQLFCGQTLVSHWHCPDHTKIENFRSRLSPATQCELANAIAQLAVRKGFARAGEVDIDSTVQQADMSYPVITELLIKACVLGDRLRSLLVEKYAGLKNLLPPIDLKEVKRRAMDYYFARRQKITQQRLPVDKKGTCQHALQQVWRLTSTALWPVIRYGHWLCDPWMYEGLLARQRQLVDNFMDKAKRLLSDTFERSFQEESLKENIHSFYRNAVGCFNKNSLKKGLEFGRQFQVGRLLGNFLWSIPNTSVRMPDTESLPTMIYAHQYLFDTALKSVATDKGYYSKENERFLLELAWIIHARI